MRWYRLAVLSLAPVIGGCAPKVNVDDPSAFEADDPAAKNQGHTAAPRTASEPGPTVIRRRRGTLARRALVRVLDEGIGAFLHGGIEVRAFFANKRFAGWEIVRFYPDDPRFAAVDLRPGDVVRTVNEQPIERPRQAQKVWESLRSAPALVIAGQRQGERFELRYDIADEPVAPAETAPGSP